MISRIYTAEIVSAGLTDANKLFVVFDTGKSMEFVKSPADLLQRIGFDLAKLDGVELMIEEHSDGREAVINYHRRTPTSVLHSVLAKVIDLPGDEYRIELV